MNQIDIHKILNMNKGRKFDVCLMNPPYDGNLHLKFLEKAIEVSDTVVNISPVRWLQDPTAKDKRGTDYKKFENTISKHIVSIDDVPLSMAKQMFNDTRFNTNLAIYYIKSNDVLEYYKDYNMNAFVRNVIDKMSASINDVLSVNSGDDSGWRVRLVELKPLNAGSGGAKGTTGYYNKFELLNHSKSSVYYNGYRDGKHWSWYNGKTGQKVYTENDTMYHSIKFNTEIEAKNFENSTKTNFYQYYHSLIKVDQHEPFAFLPFMNDYSEPWTDERFYDYFGIDEEEQKIINDYIEENK